MSLGDRGVEVKPHSDTLPPDFCLGQTPTILQCLRSVSELGISLAQTREAGPKSMGTGEGCTPGRENNRKILNHCDVKVKKNARGRTKRTGCPSVTV